MTRDEYKELLPVIIHYAHGGTLWCYDEMHAEWFELNEESLNFDLRSKSCYIIEDKFFEERKAFALGESIECLNKLTNTWESMEGTKFIQQEQYRIKPREPVYEWQWLIQYSNSEYELTKGYFTNSSEFTIYGATVEKFEPSKRERR